MQITISTKAVLSVVGTVALGVASWFAIGHIEHGNRLSRLEDSDANDQRQDGELAEIRATMRDLIKLTAELAGHSHDGTEPPPAVAEEVVEDAHAHEEEEMADQLPEEYGEFRHEQADLETILRSRGIAPTKKGTPNQPIDR
jgi:hypothetical protein